MNSPLPRLLILVTGVWLVRAVGPEFYGSLALSTNLLAAVAIQAGLWLRP